MHAPWAEVWGQAIDKRMKAVWDRLLLRWNRCLLWLAMNTPHQLITLGQLCLLIRHRQFTRLSQLVEEGLSANLRGLRSIYPSAPQGVSLLGIAIENMQVAFAQTLVRHGASVNELQSGLRTPLVKTANTTPAYFYGNRQIILASPVAILLEVCERSYEFKTDPPNDAGLDRSRSGSQDALAMMALLLDHGADVDLVDSAGLYSARSLLGDFPLSRQIKAYACQEELAMETVSSYAPLRPQRL